jgi:hypothetical protein
MVGTPVAAGGRMGGTGARMEKGLKVQAVKR